MDEKMRAATDAAAMLEAKDAIKRMCAIQDKAAAHVGYEYSADCFCGHGGFWSARGYDGTFEGGYRNDAVAIEFIEAAVAEKIEREARAQADPSSGVMALSSDLSARINRVSRRSLDGSVVMSSEEWNGIVEQVEKLLTDAPTAPAVQGGGEPVAWAVMSAGEILSVEDDEDEAVDSAKLWGASAFPLYTHPHNGEQGGEWVRCDERLPDGFQSVLVASNTGSIYTCTKKVIERKNAELDGDGFKRERFTHWMPIPQPPKSKEDRGHE